MSDLLIVKCGPLGGEESHTQWANVGATFNRP